jgi:hypothetical protein
LQSDQRCIILFVGGKHYYNGPILSSFIFCAVNTVAEPPMLVPDSMSPTGEIFSNQGLWSVQFNKEV